MKKFLIFLLLFISFRIYAQNDRSALQKLMSKDSSSIPFIFSYPDSIRSAVFTASAYPEALIKLEEIQKSTSAAFQQKISKYCESRQKDLWEITLYPELPSLLIKNKDKSKNDLKEILINYPSEISQSAIHFLKKDPNILYEMDRLRLEFEAAFNLILNDFPYEVQNSYKLIYTRPELVTALSEDIKTTLILGEIYKRNPGLLKQTADSLNMVIVNENREEYLQWKSGIEADKAIQKDLKKLADKYQKNDIYDDIYSHNDYEVNIYHIRPFPYWAGHPHWYVRVYWYPYPWWFHSGYYYNPGGRIIIRGLPSYQFGRWYYRHPSYPWRYPYANKYFHKHYEGHRNSNHDFNRSMRDKKISPRSRKQ